MSAAGTGSGPRIWVHAASVGEVGAAVLLIREVASAVGDCSFVVSTMTTSGLGVARNLLPDEIPCFLAPFDLQPAVRKVAGAVQPDLYACLETELWPVMQAELRRRGVPLVLLNGRLSGQSSRRYAMVRGLITPMLRGFSAIGAVGPRDRERFVALGAIEERIRVTGNIKYDFGAGNNASPRLFFRNRLQVDEESVFICGSTRSGEEVMLAGVYKMLREQGDRDLVWVVAPRHMDRLAEVSALLSDAGLPHDLYTTLGESPRTRQVILVDCLGELAQLYSAGDYIFVGGSLVNRGGHNLMEAARWGRPVYYGPFIEDFSDAAALLADAGAGFMVEDGRELAGLILDHMANPARYRAACRSALEAVDAQHGAAAMQAGIIREILRGRNNP